MIRIRLTHWTGGSIEIVGEFKTSGMGRGGPNIFIRNMESVANQLSNGDFNVEIELDDLPEPTVTGLKANKSNPS